MAMMIIQDFYMYTIYKCLKTVLLYYMIERKVKLTEFKMVES